MDFKNKNFPGAVTENGKHNGKEINDLFNFSFIYFTPQLTD